MTHNYRSFFRFIKVFVVFALVISHFVSSPQIVLAEVRNIHFPVDGQVSFIDDFGDPRSGGRTHEGNDLIGTKMMPLISVVDGVVKKVVIPEASWGYAIYIQDAEGFEYVYLHVNNDNPGTDDGNGGPEHAYAPGITDGARVSAGQLVGWMGDSGNAEYVGAHLHFEIHRPGGTPFSPYESLVAALNNGSSPFDPVAAKAASPTINDDKNLQVISGTPPCVSGSLIKSSQFSAVYYCGADGKRYVFANQSIYSTWYTDFKNVTTITSEQLAAIPLGGNATYRPGIRVVKVKSDPKVYAVDRGGVLRWIRTPQIAEELYGVNWGKQLDTIEDFLFLNYRLGEPISFAQK